MSFDKDKIINDLHTSLGIEKYILLAIYDIFIENQKMIRNQKSIVKDTPEKIADWKYAEYNYLNQHKHIPYDLSDWERRMIFYTFCMAFN